MILVTTDLSLSASDILYIYGLRFKIEVAFKSAIYTLGTFAYRFWIKTMKKTRRGDGTKYLHRESEEYRQNYLKKIMVYNIYPDFDGSPRCSLMILDSYKTAGALQFAPCDRRCGELLIAC